MLTRRRFVTASLTSCAAVVFAKAGVEVASAAIVECGQAYIEVIECSVYWVQDLCDDQTGEVVGQRWTYVGETHQGCEGVTQEGVC